MRPYNTWLSEIGVSRTTGWRWVKNGLVSPVRIRNRFFISPEEAQRFSDTHGHLWSRDEALVKLSGELKKLGVSDRTARRWEKEGRFWVTRINGQKYTRKQSLLGASPGRYYVYMHLRKDTRQPFYIGKGCEGRAWEKEGRGPDWESIAEKHGWEVQIVMYCAVEEAAFAYEKDLIACAGPLLVNKSPGVCKKRARLRLVKAPEQENRAVRAKEREAWKGKVLRASSEQLADLRQQLESEPRPANPGEDRLDRAKWKILVEAEARFGISGRPRPTAWERMTSEERQRILDRRAAGQRQRLLLAA